VYLREHISENLLCSSDKDVVHERLGKMANPPILVELSSRVLAYEAYHESVIYFSFVLMFPPEYIDTRYSPIKSL
jgi:hypothetical protein